MPKKEVRRGRRDGVTKRGEHWYGSWIDTTGERTRQRLEATTYTEAVEERNTKSAGARRLRITGLRAPSTDKLETFVEPFLDYQKTRQTPKSLKRTKGVLNRAEVKYLLALPVNTIHGPQIDSLVSTLSSLKMSKRGKPTRVTHTALVNLRGKLHHREYTRTVWSKEQADITPGALLKEFAIWKALFSWLMTVQEVIPRNPTANVKATKKKPASRKTFIESREDLKRIIDACPPWLQPIVKFAAHTGMRRGEILGLKWAEVDFTNELATLIETKNGDERPVPLNKTALAVVRSIRPKKAKPTDFVFHPGHEVAATRQADDNVSKAFKAVCVRCGYPDITFHDLRRTAGSHMRMTGSDVLTVAEGLGHRDMRTTKRYQRAIPAHLRKAYDLLDEALGDDPPTFLGSS